jgi:hypothetical protein
MSSFNVNDPYGQVTLPYQPPILSQQKKPVSLSNVPRVDSSQNKAMRSSSASTSRRISKAEALTIVHRCKKWLIGGSLVSFGILTALVMGHTVGTTSTQAKPAANNQTIPTLNAPATSSSSSSDEGDFFQQQQQLQLQQQGGGYGFGDRNAWQPPVSRSTVS